MRSLITVFIGLLLLSIYSTSYADDSARINKLETEILELKSRLNILEIEKIRFNQVQNCENQEENWKQISNWRKLSIKMSSIDVKIILGEPIRLDGGTISHWHYPSGGVVVFFHDKVRQWTEPSL